MFIFLPESAVHIYLVNRDIVVLKLMDWLFIPEENTGTVLSLLSVEHSIECHGPDWQASPQTGHLHSVHVAPSADFQGDRQSRQAGGVLFPGP